MAQIHSTTLMGLLVAIVVLSSLGGGGGGSSTKETIFNDYLKRPKMIQVSHFHRQTRKWLQTVQVEAESSPELVLQQLKEASFQSESAKRDKYEKLISIADGGFECPKDVVDLIISIYAQLDLPQQKPLEHFLDHFVRQKFQHCSSTLNNSMELQQRNSNELEIDQFFKLRLNLEKESTDFEVYKAIRCSSNRKFQLNFNQCSELLKQFGNILNIMNLASAVGLQADYEARLLKLNEYNRFCPSELISGDY